MVFRATLRATALRAAYAGRAVGGVLCLTTGGLREGGGGVCRQAKGVLLARGVPGAAALLLCVVVVVFWRLSSGGRRRSGVMDAAVGRLRWYCVHTGRGVAMWVRVVGGVLGVRLPCWGLVRGGGGVGRGRGSVPGVRHEGGQLLFVLQAVESEAQRREGRRLFGGGCRGVWGRDGHGGALRGARGARRPGQQP